MQEKKQNIQIIARKLIRFLRAQEKVASGLEKDRLWNRIENEVRKEKATHRQHQLYWILATAASLAGIIWCGNWYNQNYSTNSNIKHVASVLTHSIASDKEIVLTVPGKKQVEVANNSQVSYTKDGSVSINSETINPEDTIQKDTSKEDEYNQLIVPRGRRSQLVLSDGSRLWVNAGTRVVYPSNFTQKNREIFIEGEVYLEVSHDNQHPFVVKTTHFDVQVLGTSFNVCAYKDTEKAEVVLAKGSVRIKDEYNDTAQLTPNQLISINRNRIGQINDVIASEYTCWTDGLLILHAEPITTVFRKLNLYYGEDIQFDESINDIPLSGKLDLKDRLDDVIRLISKTAPISYKREGNKLFVKRKI